MDTPILLVHISSQIAAWTIRDAQTRLLPIYAETCPQYLYLLSERLKGKNFEGTSFSSCSFDTFLIFSPGAKSVCSPPPRDSVEDINALWKGITNGTFTTFSSDHAATK
jgi:dihydropyrimidinase